MYQMVISFTIARIPCSNQWLPVSRTLGDRHSANLRGEGAIPRGATRQITLSTFEVTPIGRGGNITSKHSTWISRMGAEIRNARTLAIIFDFRSTSSCSSTDFYDSLLRLFYAKKAVPLKCYTMFIITYRRRV